MGDFLFAGVQQASTYFRIREALMYADIRRKARTQGVTSEIEMPVIYKRTRNEKVTNGMDLKLVIHRIIEQELDDRSMVEEYIDEYLDLKWNGPESTDTTVILDFMDIYDDTEVTTSIQGKVPEDKNAARVIATEKAAASLSVIGDHLQCLAKEMEHDYDKWILSKHHFHPKGHQRTDMIPEDCVVHEYDESFMQDLEHFMLCHSFINSIETCTRD